MGIRQSLPQHENPSPALSLNAQPIYRKILARSEKKEGRAKRVYEATPKTPYERLVESADIPEAKKRELRDRHAKLDPFELKKNIEIKLKKFFIVLGNLNREAAKL